mgnify:CR=1 FL=1
MFNFPFYKYPAHLEEVELQSHLRPMHDEGDEEDEDDLEFFILEMHV